MAKTKGTEVAAPPPIKLAPVKTGMKRIVLTDGPRTALQIVDLPEAEVGFQVTYEGRFYQHVDEVVLEDGSLVWRYAPV